MPERLVRIHFPVKDPNKDPSTATPWYWFYERQQPQAFSFLAPPFWGPGWVRTKNFGIIKILPIDSQGFVPLPQVGATSLQNAVSKVAEADTSWGRFDFRDDRLWDLVKGQAGLPKEKPKFDVVKGLIKARDPKTNINKIIEACATRFRDDWLNLANGYNQQAAGVNPSSGFHYQNQSSPYNFPLPKGPPAVVTQFQQQLQAFERGPPYLQGAAFIGPVPATAFFQIPTFDISAYAFTLTIGQLDPKKYNMGVFPPIPTATIGNGSPSDKSKDYSGFGKTPFPFAGPQVI